MNPNSRWIRPKRPPVKPAVPSVARLALLAAATLALAGCDSLAPESAPAGAVSEGEEAALEEAARMLDEQRLPEGALPDVDPPIEAQGAETR